MYDKRQVDKKHYCSRECFLKNGRFLNNKRDGEMKECCVCKKSKYFKYNRIQKNSTGLFFCSRDCFFTYPQELKDKLSISRKKYLENNPDKHVWKRKDKAISKPCEHFKQILIKNHIQFVEEFSPSKTRAFSIDIAFPDRMIGIEINGTFHYQKDGKLKPYYQDRENHIESLGWKLYQIH